MPVFFKKNLFSSERSGVEDKETFLPSPLDTPELPTRDEKSTETFLSWVAPARPYRKKDKSFFVLVAIIILLVCGILLFWQISTLLVLALLALGFLVYVINSVIPEDVSYKISAQGITVENNFYHWKELDSFWFSEKDGFKLLHIFTRLRFPGALILVLKDLSEEEVKKICVKYLPFHEIPPSNLIDKLSELLQKIFPLENTLK